MLNDTRVMAGFDTVELTVAPGGTVTCTASRAGWDRCRDVSGPDGWLPAPHLSQL